MILGLCLGFIIALGICGMADMRAVDSGKIQIKSKWYRLVPCTRVDAAYTADKHMTELEGEE